MGHCGTVPGCPRLARLARVSPATWPGLAQVIGDRFATASRDEWTATFAGINIVTPVLAPGEVLTPPPALHPDAGGRGRDGGTPDATAEVLAGLSNEDARRRRRPRRGIPASGRLTNAARDFQ